MCQRLKADVRLSKHRQVTHTVEQRSTCKILVFLHQAARRNIENIFILTLAMFIVSQELSKSLRSETGKLYAVKCDVTNNSDIETAFKWVKDNLGGVDILVNNAGVLLISPLIGKWPRHLLVVLLVCFC